MSTLGSKVSNTDVADLVAGKVPTAQLGSGSSISAKFLRGDQTWATPGGATFGAPAIVLGTTPGNGAIDEVIRRDATIVAFNDGANPTNSNPGDVTDTGNDAFAARRDHRHARELRRVLFMDDFTRTFYSGQPSTDNEVSTWDGFQWYTNLTTGGDVSDAGTAADSTYAQSNGVAILSMLAATNVTFLLSGKSGTDDHTVSAGTGLRHGTKYHFGVGVPSSSDVWASWGLNAVRVADPRYPSPGAVMFVLYKAATDNYDVNSGAKTVTGGNSKDFVALLTTSGANNILITPIGTASDFITATASAMVNCTLLFEVSGGLFNVTATIEGFSPVTVTGLAADHVHGWWGYHVQRPNPTDGAAQKLYTDYIISDRPLPGAVV